MTGIRLHGYPVSNYVNVARAALLEKRLPHALVRRGATRDDDFLAMNPMGRIPVLEDDGFLLAETVAILEYLDDRYPQISLRPADAQQRARGRQIIQIVQGDVEAPARSLYPGVFMGGHNSAAAVNSARAKLDRATTALRRLMTPDQLLPGGQPMQADLFAFHHLQLVERLGGFLWGRSIIAEAGLEQWHDAMAARDSSHIIAADFEAAFHHYLAEKGAAWRAPAVGNPVHA